MAHEKISETIPRVASGTERLYFLVTNGHTFIDFIEKKNEWMIMILFITFKLFSLILTNIVSWYSRWMGGYLNQSLNIDFKERV